MALANFDSVCQTPARRLGCREERKKTNLGTLDPLSLSDATRYSHALSLSFPILRDKIDWPRCSSLGWSPRSRWRRGLDTFQLGDDRVVPICIVVLQGKTNVRPPNSRADDQITESFVGRDPDRWFRVTLRILPDPWVLPCRFNSPRLGVSMSTPS